jgi:nucleoside-diphosphate-sugar epimerase
VTVCVTGATGFIGSHVANLASEIQAAARAGQGLGLSAPAGVRLARRAGVLRGVQAAERDVGRRLVLQP